MLMRSSATQVGLIGGWPNEPNWWSVEEGVLLVVVRTCILELDERNGVSSNSEALCCWNRTSIATRVELLSKDGLEENSIATAGLTLFKLFASVHIDQA